MRMKLKINNFLHKLFHKLGWFTGHIVSVLDKETNTVWVGFQCNKCGKIEHWHKTKY